MTYKILSFDGGGIRGLVSAILLDGLVSQDGLSGLIDDADLLVGTSTGGLIGLSLAAGQNAADLVEIYKTKGATIFRPYSDDYGATSVKYVNDGVFALATKWLDGFPTMGSLRSSSGRDVAVVAAQLWDPNALSMNDKPQGSWMPRYISSLPGSPFSGLDPVEAALVTSAAPIYFPPVPITGVGSDYDSYYVDGGLVANNPLAFAVAQVLGAGLATPDEIRIISIGTATSSFGIPNAAITDHLEGAKSWGADRWLDLFGSGPTPTMPLLELALSMNEELSTASAAAMFGEPNQNGSNFLRAEPVISPYAMDDYQDIAQLESEVATYMQEKNGEWSQILALAPTVWNS